MKYAVPQTFHIKSDGRQRSFSGHAVIRIDKHGKRQYTESIVNRKFFLQFINGAPFSEQEIPLCQTVNGDNIGVILHYKLKSHELGRIPYHHINGEYIVNNSSRTWIDGINLSRDNLNFQCKRV